MLWGCLLGKTLVSKCCLAGSKLHTWKLQQERKQEETYASYTNCCAVLLVASLCACMLSLY